MAISLLRYRTGRLTSLPFWQLLHIIHSVVFKVHVYVGYTPSFVVWVLRFLLRIAERQFCFTVSLVCRLADVVFHYASAGVMGTGHLEQQMRLPLRHR